MTGSAVSSGEHSGDKSNMVPALGYLICGKQGRTVKMIK